MTINGCEALISCAIQSQIKCTVEKPCLVHTTADLTFFQNKANMNSHDYKKNTFDIDVV